MGLLTLTQIPCHHVLANQIYLNLKYHIGLKHFFNINLGIGIIKKTTFFVCIFDISPCVLTQISIGRSPWMQNKILHPTSTYSIYFWQSRLPKKKKHLKTWWWCHHHIFRYFLFLGSRFHQNYIKWVLVGCGI